MGAVDGDAPGQVGRRPVELLVEEVAPARDALGEERAGHDDVEGSRERDAPTAHEDPDADGGADDAAVEPEAGVGRQDGPKRVVRVGLPLADDVVEAGPDEREEGHHDDRVRDEAPGRSPLRRASERLTSDEDDGRQDEADAVEADAQRPERRGRTAA